MKGQANLNTMVAELAVTVDVLQKGQAELVATVDALPKKGQADLSKGQAELNGITSHFIVARYIQKFYGLRFLESFTVAGPDDFVNALVQSGVVDKALIGVLTKALEANVLAQARKCIGPAFVRYAFPQPQCVIVQTKRAFCLHDA